MDAENKIRFDGLGKFSPVGKTHCGIVIKPCHIYGYALVHIQSFDKRLSSNEIHESFLDPAALGSGIGSSVSGIDDYYKVVILGKNPFGGTDIQFGYKNQNHKKNRRYKLFECLFFHKLREK